MVRYHQRLGTVLMLCLFGFSLVACGAANDSAAGLNNVSATASADNEAETNPVAQRIADEFGVPVSDVEAYHDQGIGYGVLAQFYAIMSGRCGGQSQYTVQQLVDMHNNGMGLGEIRQQALGTAAARDCNLGRLTKDELNNADAGQQGKGNSNGDGQGKGKGKDK